MKYKIRIGTQNRMILWKGKQTRTPVELISTEKELAKIKLLIKSEGIIDYDINEYDNPNSFDIDTISEIHNNEVITENDENDNSNSILSKLLKEELK